jgi:condensin complex subunit 3
MSVGELFADAQRSNVGHKTLAKRLKRLENSSNFEAQVKQCIFRLLDVSKSEVAGNRVVKFLTIYLQDADASSPTTSSILLALLPFLLAKDKTVRYRATQLVSQILGVLSAIDDDLYQLIRHELIKRLHDKVPAIRLEAVVALGKVVENEMDDEPEEQDSDEDVAPGLLEKLLDVLQNDTSADVRRALLLNLPITPTTLPYLLERARDRDAPTRRTLYSRLLPKLGDFRHLSLSMREKLLRWGLRDRDEKVRKAAARLFAERWIEDCAGTKAAGEGEVDKTKLHEASIPALLELLERIDIINSGGESGIGLDAMKEFWTARPDYVDAVAFDDDFWSNLTTESAFMARTFIQTCSQDPALESKLEDKMPEVTRLGFYLQNHLNTMLETIRKNGDAEEPNEEEQAEREFIVEQLLHIAHCLDYTDEIGRRKIFTLLRNAISVAELPDEVTRLAVEALRLVCSADTAGEREFTSVVLDAISDVHDTILPSDPEMAENDDDSFVSARSEVSDSTPTRANQRKKKGKRLTEEEEEQAHIKEILVNMKCLHIAQCMLQNVTSNLQSNVHLENMLNNLVVPAVRSYEMPVRERGVLCLGLCCMLEPKLAEENRPVFMTCLVNGHDGLKTMSLQILCDILLSHGHKKEKEGSVDIAPFAKALSMSDEVQSCATLCLGKLMVCGFYKGNEEAFDKAVDKAVTRTCKGWEVLGKIRAAVQTDSPMQEQQEEEEEGSERRKSAD